MRPGLYQGKEGLEFGHIEKNFLTAREKSFEQNNTFEKIPQKISKYSGLIEFKAQFRSNYQQSQKQANHELPPK